jgi:NADPH:quinone reductase-like Zn-dependent oxidoreductase
MKAIVRERYGPPEDLEFREVADPSIGEGEVLVAVRAAGVDRGVWHVVTGLPYLVRVSGFGVRAPRRPVCGTDVSGRVEAVGAGVEDLRPGDEVFGTCDGAFAEYAIAAARRLVVKPPNVSHEQAAAVPTSAGAALQSLCDKGQLRAGQRVLVIGAAGGVGSFAVQLATIFGAEVSAVCSGDAAEFVRSLGAHDVIDHRTTDVTRTGRRYDLVIDLAGNRSLTALRRTLTPKGTLVIVGGELGTRLLGGTSRQVRALLLSPLVGQQLRSLLASERREDLLTLKTLLEYGQLVPRVDRTFALPDTTAAIAHLLAGGVRGKVVVKV